MCPSPIELSNGLGLHKPMLLASAQRAARVRDLDESERMWTDGPALFARLRAKMLFSPLCLLFNNWSLLHALQDFKIQDLSHFKWTDTHTHGQRETDAKQRTTPAAAAGATCDASVEPFHEWAYLSGSGAVSIRSTTSPFTYRRALCLPCRMRDLGSRSPT